MDAQQKPPPPGRQRLQWVILRHMRETHRPPPGTWQAALKAEQRAGMLWNIYAAIKLAKPDLPDPQILQMAFGNESERFLKEGSTDEYVTSIKGLLQRLDRIRRENTQTVESSTNPGNNTANIQESMVHQTATQPSGSNQYQGASKQASHPPDPSSMERENSSFQNHTQVGDMKSQQSDTEGNPFVNDSLRVDHSSNRLRASEAGGMTDLQPSPVNPLERYGRALGGIGGQDFESVVDSNARDSGYGSAIDTARTVSVYQDGQKEEEGHSHQNDGFDDVATVATDGPELNLPLNSREYLIQQFVEELLTAFPPATVPVESLDHIKKVLPNLLRQYAIRLTEKTQSRDEENAVRFVRQNRTYIAEALHEQLCEDQEWTSRKLFSSEDHPETNWYDRTIQWINGHSADASQVQEDLEYLSDAFDEDEASNLPDLSPYKLHLLGGAAYKWLISRLRAELLLANPDAFAMKQIREVILQNSPPSEKPRISFHVDWNPSAFFEEQGYKENCADELPRAITITGSSISAQATSCEQYLLDTWPITGALTLTALQHAISDDQNDTPAFSLQNSNLRISLEETHVQVDVMGENDFITDVGEQLGWIGAALRSSKADGQMCYCVPSVTYSEDVFTINYSSDPVTDTESIINGNCWHPLFNNPAIVRGFPTSMRRTRAPDEGLPGLEIPLNMMAEVVEANRVTEIDGKLLIKGFSTLLVPTKRVDDLVIWHLIYNEDGSRISYFDVRGIDISDTSIEGLTFSALESARHVLGWCSVAKILAGSRYAKYDIKLSGLDQPGHGWTFEKVSITGGKIINGGVTFGKGNINTALHLQRQPVYVKQIHDARLKYVILYDIEDKRAWLLNGADAILHLVRAYLSFAKKDPDLRTKVKFSFSDLWVPDDEYDACAPFQILCNDKNKNLVIYEDWKRTHKRTIDAKGNITEVTEDEADHLRFRNQVDEIYHIWEQIQDFQTKMTDNIRFTDRDKLQGYNFMDIATGGKTIKPRFTYLTPSGRGWVDLARSLDAITLFGSGFGELIQPSSESNKLCDFWRHLPIDYDYLAVSMSDIRRIFNTRGDATTRPMKLADGIFWHKADRLFESCECVVESSRVPLPVLKRRKGCDRAQVLLPPSFGRMIDPGPLEEKGAVIFGKTARYIWPNQGPPEEAAGPDEDSESERPQKRPRSIFRR